MDIKDIEKEKFKYTSQIMLQGVPIVCIVIEIKKNKCIELKWKNLPTLCDANMYVSKCFR